MAVGRISKRTVDALPVPEAKKRSFLWDGSLKGFGVMALPSGAKTYVVQFRQGGVLRRYSIGRHGRLTPEEARSEAKKLLGQAEVGLDPIAARKAAAGVPTFKEIMTDFLDKHAASRCKPRTLTEYRRWSDRLVEKFGSRKVNAIAKAHVRDFHAGLSSTPIEANRVLSLFKAAWNWAVAEDLIDIPNPATGIKKFREQVVERFLSSAELARLGAALAEAETVGLPYSVDEAKPTAKHAARPENRRTVADPFAVAAIRLLLFTGARRQEILKARWSDFDAERGMLMLPDSKTGKKVVYLSAAALTVLANLPRIEGHPFIIPGLLENRPRADLNKPWAAVKRAANLEGLRLHDLRHSFASFGAGSSMGLPLIGKLLGHSQAATTNRYAHLAADPLRRAADTIGATIEAGLAGRGNAASADVVPLKRQG
jgi:integrase